jgi:hypothetical protein
MGKLDKFKSQPADENIVKFQKHRRKVEGFAQVPLRVAAEFSKKMNNADFAVFIMLIYKAFRVGDVTFEMSSDLTTVHGVHREAKRRALIRFEEAGVIKLERRKGKTSVVTLLLKLD